MQKITTILIDVDNTLLDFNKCAENAIKKGFVLLNLEYSDNVLDIFLEVNHIFWDNYEKNIITRDDITKNRWNEIFDKLGIKNQNGEDFERTFVKNLFEGYYKVEGALEILEYLSKKYTVHIASNSKYTMQVKRLKNAELLQFVNEIFVSDVVGFAKPLTEFFDFCFKKMPNIKKENVVMIGDSVNADIKGGKDYGIKTIWFNYYQEPSEKIADFEVIKLIDIKNIL